MHHERPQLSSDELRRQQTRLSEAFEVRLSDVVTDARRLDAWVGPRDEFLVGICEAHRWRAEMGVLYIAHLVRQLDLAAGPLPAAWSCD